MQSSKNHSVGSRARFSIVGARGLGANHLTVGPAGGNGKADVESNATALKLKVGGHSVYAVFIAPGNGYRNNKTTSIPTGNGAQGAYMVTSGTHLNNGCCFDYGNAETSNNDTGNGHMDPAPDPAQRRARLAVASQARSARPGKCRRCKHGGQRRR